MISHNSLPNGDEQTRLIYAMVRPLVLRMNLDRAVNDTDDIVQIVQMTVHRFGGQFRGQTSAEYHAWLRQVVYLTVLRLGRDSRRKKRQRATACVELGSLNDMEDSAHQERPIEQVIFKEESHRMRAAMCRLDPLERSLIEYHIFDELSFQKIGEILGKSPSGVRYRYDKAIEQLINEFNRHSD